MAPPLPNRRLRSPPRTNRRLRLLLSIASLFLLLLLASAAVLRRANALGRRCMPEITDYSGDPAVSRNPDPPKIAMVSFSQEERSAERRTARWRSFRGLMDTVGGNKRAYAEKMGYDFVDSRDLVDPSRPPSWSKILAVRSLLPDYDWVFWNDADTVVTNPDVSLENILQSAIGHVDFYRAPDLVVTEDVNGVNSGVFFVRRSTWSKDFLDKWWNQTPFIRFGSTKSGDNAAMKHLIDNLSPEELQRHVRVSPMQCLFNSYPWFLTWKSAYRLISSPQTIWRGTYSKGDFMVHLAGLDGKKELAAKIIQEINGS